MEYFSIRKYRKEEIDAIWEIFSRIVISGDTYAYDPDISKNAALKEWLEKPLATYVAVEDGKVLGTYFIKQNQPGLGGHVCNCGYMVSREARGKGVATRMCEHSQEEARKFGFKAMQFNLVIASNEGAVRLWQKLGFAIAGTLPKAFAHQKLGYVDAFVMYKWLGNDE